MSEKGSEGNNDLALLERFVQAVEGGTVAYPASVAPPDIVTRPTSPNTAYTPAGPPAIVTRPTSPNTAATVAPPSTVTPSRYRSSPATVTLPATDLALLEQFAQAVEEPEEGNVQMHVMPDRIIEVIRKRILDVEQQLESALSKKVRNENECQDAKKREENIQSQLPASKTRLVYLTKNYGDLLRNMTSNITDEQISNYYYAVSSCRSFRYSCEDARREMYNNEEDQLVEERKSLESDIKRNEEYLDEIRKSIEEYQRLIKKYIEDIQRLTALRDRYEELILHIIEKCI